MQGPLVGVLVAAGLAGCARTRPAIEFVGRSREPIVQPWAVEESEALPREAARLGRLLARCRAVDTSEAFEERPLTDVDCSETRLRFWLKQEASEQGGDVLAEVRCRSGHTTDCSAIVGRRDASSNAQVRLARGQRTLDVRGSVGATIWVSYVPVLPRFERSRHDLDDVGELSTLPLSHFVVGSLETECEACDERALRQALRLAAGRVGASDVVAVRCLAGSGMERCVGEAAVPLVVEPPDIAWKPERTPP